ncbi:MerR family transcriptional regulator [Parasphingopyxis algicola]|uniref:MerR family transcriptional regulator n=1 Tax=Parasphingopyxis algicola TaxID=2026624 RepID=UPI0015A392F8|nr:MerR family transcriptional regulator [Parasphingopyxis algicola]QLC26590.1 MerR family transcriptional regulator [Parasphingopyxis algicola]
MADSLDISEVARRTGLTARTLRFYESRGLLAPGRTAGGRRVYTTEDLSAIHRIMLLKGAGFTIAQIRQLFEREDIGLSRLVQAQLDLLAAEAGRIAEARALLGLVLSRIERGDEIDAETLCALIESGERTLRNEPEDWKRVADRYFPPRDRVDWAEASGRLPPGLDEEAYTEQWRALGERIEAALPIDPASAEAQAFVDEWFALLKPFAEVATPEVWNGTYAMYEDMEAWAGSDGEGIDPGFSKGVWDFIKLATAARMTGIVSNHHKETE